MPWPWLMVEHCIDLRTGAINHWPFPQENWGANKFHLEAMQAVWRALRFFTKPASKWDEYDVDYFDWLESD